MRRTYQLPRLHPAFDSFRIVQISDLHVGTGMNTQRLMHIAALVNQQQADAVVITGDFITQGKISAPHAQTLREGLGAIQAPERAAVLGNHDHWADPEGVRSILSEVGIRDLSNAAYSLQRGDALLHLCGVDDHWEHLDRMDRVLAALPDDGAAVLLAHEPDYADISAATGRFDLQLSGHSHGGQVIVPLLNRPLVLPRLGKKYPIGEYRVNGMIQYTNCGLGTIKPAVRFNCRPEITVFTLRAGTTAAAAPSGA